MYLHSRDFVADEKFEQQEANMLVEGEAINANAPYYKINSQANFAGFQRRFIFELMKWANCPPSDNLWIIKIVPHNDGGAYINPNNTLVDLYNNILMVNNNWRVADKWAINTRNIANGVTEGITGNFLNQFDSDGENHGGIFLVQDITIAHNDVQILENIHNDVLAQSGWITYGKGVSNKNNSLTANINFLVSNYEIQDVFFDRWIAAIGQQGLIEDSNLPNIKADIYLYCYAASTPETNKNDYYYKLRKIVTLYKAFPIRRDEESKKYSFEDAGKFKSQKVEFRFENYHIDYNFDIDILSSSGKENMFVDPDWSPGAG